MLVFWKKGGGWGFEGQGHGVKGTEEKGTDCYV